MEIDQEVQHALQEWKTNKQTQWATHHSDNSIEIINPVLFFNNCLWIPYGDAYILMSVVHRRDNRKI